VQKESIRGLACISSRLEIRFEGFHEVAPALTVVLCKRLHQGAEWLQRTAACELLQKSLRLHRLPFQRDRGLDLARRIYQILTARAKKAADLRPKLGGVRMEASRAEMFRKLLERDPENPMVLYSLGNELFRQKKYSEAREYLSRAVRNKPDYSVAHRTLGRTLYELGEDAEARWVFAEGREVAQKNGDLQTIKEIDVFVRRLEKRERGEAGA
jgi:tetratricopeptide (TPR) repeat protein